MDKISSQDAANLTKHASVQLTKVAAHSRQLEKTAAEQSVKLAHYTKLERARGLVDRMIQDGTYAYDNPLAYQEKVASVMAHPDLSVIETALDLELPHMKHASVAASDDVSNLEFEGLTPRSEAERNLFASMLSDATEE
jgi:hypothetical protein